MFEKQYLYLLIPIVLLLLVVLILFFPKIFRGITQWFSRFLKALAAQSGGTGPITGNENIDNLIAIAGYSYDPVEDLFYSSMNAWQRKMGYCRLYDEAAAPSGMIIDCEPIYFSYAGKRWLIEFWKGQYNLMMGCEVGIYTSEEPSSEDSGPNVSDLLSNNFYNCASDQDRLPIAYTLKRNKKSVFSRQGTHWWLTGFKLGEFAEPSELSVEISIVLKDADMCKAFISGLKKAGYSDKDLKVTGLNVTLCFDNPHTTQPVTRTEEIEKFTQANNKLLCEQYSQITKDYHTLPEKLKAVREQAPELYGYVLKFGKSTELFNFFKA